MRLFTCQVCGQVLYFENRNCQRCGHTLGYLPDDDLMIALEQDGESWLPAVRTEAVAETNTPDPADPGRRLLFCANAGHDACNWLVEEGGETFCAACRFNREIPDLSVGGNLARWRNLELGKHRLFYSLMHLKLPLANRIDDPTHGLVFDFLAVPRPGDAKVMTGHDEGVITINLVEGDAAEREKLREAMGEPYRTPLGHFRHEIAHYYWDVLVRDAGDDGKRLADCRAVFGDDSADYGEALKRHYANGAPADWQQNYVSAYATSHPWEDFAETWAHYLHIVDTLEMAGAFGVRVQPTGSADPTLTSVVDFDPHAAPSAEALVERWLPLTFAVNSLNRSMGQSDLYPFVLPQPVIAKLEYIHRLIHATA